VVIANNYTNVCQLVTTSDASCNCVNEQERINITHCCRLFSFLYSTN